MDRTFTLPDAAVEETGRVKWARLYVSSYCGHMQDAKYITYTTKADWNNDGTWDNTWTETDEGQAYGYMQGGDYGPGNDNSEFEGHGTEEPYLMLNDHTTRVTSDYLSWYDVTDLIQAGEGTIKVNVDATGSNDGRIKVVELVVAYDDPSSATQTTYWVNEGHDACTYYTEENEGQAAVGTTTFDTSGLTGITSATLIADYMASNNGYYGFPTADNDFTYTGETPPVEGTFTNAELDRDSVIQGLYSGLDSWDVTSSVTGSSDVTFGYSRYFPGTGTAAYYKIPLAFLVVKSPLQSTSAPVADFTVNVTSGTAPLAVNFADNSTGTVSSYAWDFNNDGTVDSEEQNPVYTYETAGTYSVNLTVSNASGSDSEVKTDLITVNSAATNDLSITGTVNPVPASTVFARETNTVKITNIKNTGTASLTDISVALYASDVSSVVPVNTTVITSLASGGTATVTLIDPTIRNLESGTVTYAAVVDPDNLISETDETNNNKSTSAAKSVKYNGYKGKGIYWEGGSNITTQHTYDLKGNLLYSTQSDSAYKGVGWTTRTESWGASDLPISSGSTIEKVFLYFAYNWDQTAGGYPWLTLNFNGNILDNGNLSSGNGTLYRDWSNFGSYADYEYGLCVYDVTDKFSSSGNSLVTDPYDSSYNKVALYPSTLVVVYSNPDETRKQIFINEECDELAVSATSYGTTAEEATAYAPFTGMSIDVSKVTNATLYSFAGSAGPDEGNLLFNGNIVATSAWSGGSNTASPLVFNATNYINATGNEAGVQSTGSGGMDALQQILVVEYQESVPVADFTATPTSGDAPLTVNFTDASTGTVSSYAWDFDNDGDVDSEEQNPSYTYESAGTYTVNLTVTNAAGSDSKVISGYITVSEPSVPEPDLIVSSITLNSGEIFANEANTISAKVENGGSSAAGPFTVSFTVNGVDMNVTVDSLSAGANTTVSITDPTIRAYGDSVEVTALADSEYNISESDEDNNVLSLTKTVVYNGYKGKRWTDGDDINTREAFDGKYDVIYSCGNSAYASSKWSSASDTWTASDLPIPANATVVSALLYQPYTFNKMGSDPAFTAVFNSVTISADEAYKDTKGYGSYNYPYGLYVYNVTEQFSTTGNTLTLTPEGTPGTTNDYSLWGAYLVVVYSDPATTEKQILINDGFDMLNSKSSYSVTSDEATAYANFSDVDGSDIESAEVIAILGSAADSEKSKFFFNNEEYTGFWADYLTTPQIGFSVYNVTDKLVSGTNEARFQSYDSGSGGDNMYAMNAIFVAEYSEPAPVADFVVNTTSGSAPLTVKFTDNSTGTVTSQTWDFDNDGNVDSYEQNPSYTYLSAGNYTVNLTVIGPGGQDSEVKGGLIVVSEPLPEAPVANFTANETSGTAPMTVQFTDTSTGTPTSWQWDFNNDGETDSTEQTPTYTYENAGNYTVKLIVANAGGSDSEVKAEYITVSEPLPEAPVANFTATPVSGNAPLSVNFTDLSTGDEITSWFWDFDNDGNIDSSEQNPSYTYDTAGTYTVNLTVANAGGSTSEVKSDYIAVSEPSTPTKPVAAFTADVTNGTAPLTVNFTDQSTGTQITWYWDFGDGEISGEQNPTHTYTSAGVYTVTLTVTNTDGTDSEIKTDYIVVSSQEIPDTTNPVIESVVLFPANTTAGSTIYISVNATDDIGVTEVKAGDAQLTESDGVWQGSITAPSSLGDYSLQITVKDAAGNTAETSVSYHVVKLSGGVNIAASPRSSSVAAGDTVSLSIKVKNTQNIDDTFKVRISVSGLPASYQADLSWFNWTEKVVTLKAGEQVLIPVEVTVPSGTAAGYKLFRANVNSETSSITGFDTGYLIVSEISD